MTETSTRLLSDSAAFSGFSVDDIDAARTFYAETLGLFVTTNEMGFLELQLDSGAMILVYAKPNHTPASFTILNFPVPDIDVAVDQLAARGVEFQHHEWDGGGTDERGILREGGPLIAWFTDPAGNVLSVIQLE